MKRSLRIALGIAALLVGLVVAYATWTRVRSPLSGASDDSYAVWIALLKGFAGDVVYVGSDEVHAYFRLGYVFWSYYRIPTCAVDLPETFAVGRGNPYAVQLHVQNGQVILTDQECDRYQGNPFGELERKRPRPQR